MAYTDQQVDGLIRSVDQLTGSVHSLVRTINGAEQEGNAGLLARMRRIEKQHDVFRWSVPFALFGGSGTGALIAKFLGSGVLLMATVLLVG